MLQGHSLFNQNRGRTPVAAPSGSNRWVIGLLVMLFAVVGTAGEALADDHTGHLHTEDQLLEVSGNLSNPCSAINPLTGLGFVPGTLEFKYDSGVNGTVNLNLSGAGWTDPAATITLTSADGKFVDWVSAQSIDAVFIKGGDAGNWFLYSGGEKFSDAGLHSPEKNGGIPEISHVSFCFDYDMAITKTANTSLTTTTDWTITKSDDASYNRLIGSAPVSHVYDIDVTRVDVDSKWAVSGNIAIENTAPFSVALASVTDTLPGALPVVDCGGALSIAASGSLTCTYTATLTDGSPLINTATVVSNTDGIAGGEATASVDFSLAAVTFEGEPLTINVTDPNAPAGTFLATSSSTSFSYPVDFTCSVNPGDYTNGNLTTQTPNVATISETQESDSANVQLNCFAPVVSKDADTSFTRTHNWEIEKSVLPLTDSGLIGDSLPFTYTVSVSETDPTESAFEVAGTISVGNPSPLSMTVSVADSIASADLDCGGTLIIGPNSSASCGYTASLVTKTDGTNTATIGLNGVSFAASDGYDFASAVVTEVDTSINVTDANAPANTFASTSVDATWSYDVSRLCSTDTALYTDGTLLGTLYDNTATITETGGTADASATVDCYAPVVTKDAETSYTRTHDWTISKIVGPESGTGFVGDSFTFDYEVSVVEDEQELDFAIAGTITVVNPAPVATGLTMDVSIVDHLAGATLNCGSGDLLVAAASSATCGYSASLDAKVDGTNTATVTLNGLSPIGFDASADYVFGIPTTVIGEPNIDVTDTNGDAWNTSTSESWTYSVVEACSLTTTDYANGVDVDVYNNEATITLTDASASTSVPVDCYAPVVTKNATTSYNRDHSWDLSKSVTTIPSQTGFVGDEFTFGYIVAVDETEVDSAWTVAGSIDVVNNHPTEAMTIAVADLVGGNAADLLCGGTLTVTANGGSASCGYTAGLTDATAGTNTATVTLGGVGFDASVDYLFGAPTSHTGDETINVTDSNPTAGPWTASEDAEWAYDVLHPCSVDTTTYTGGVDFDEYPNTAKITETGLTATDQVDVTCFIPAITSVLKTTSEGPEDIGGGPFTFVLSDTMGDLETVNLNGAGSVNFNLDLENEGNYAVTEILPEGWFNDATVCEFSILYPADAGNTVTCSFDNREAARVTVLKHTEGVVDSARDWKFSIYAGPNADSGLIQNGSNNLSDFLGLPLASDTTSGDVDGILDFDGLNLDPLQSYTVCETNIAAGWTSIWSAGGFEIAAYNPNTSNYSPLTPNGQDVGNRCVDFNAGDPIPQPLPVDLKDLSPGTTLAFTVNNTFPGGSARTPGYWKNWNYCSDGGQAANADRQGGASEGFYLLENVLPQMIGELNVNDCATGVAVLDMRTVDRNRKQANDAAYYVAMSLMAARANVHAGAAQCQQTLELMDAGQALLLAVGFDGTGSYLKSPKGKADATQFNLAREIGGLLDEYNNGLLCQ